MITKLQILILVLSILDLSATWFYVSTFHSKFPEQDYSLLEANPILRMAYHKFGLNLGSLIGSLIVFGLLTLVVFTISRDWQLFFSGVFVMMMLYHLLNYFQLRAL